MDEFVIIKWCVVERAYHGDFRQRADCDDTHGDLDVDRWTCETDEKKYRTAHLSWSGSFLFYLLSLVGHYVHTETRLERASS